MIFNQVNDKISENGYRRHASTRSMYDETTGTEMKIYDYEHKRKLDMFSVYVNEFGGVETVEFTKVDFNRETKKYSQSVKVITNINELNRALA